MATSNVPTRDEVLAEMAGTAVPSSVSESSTAFLLEHIYGLLAEYERTVEVTFNLASVGVDSNQGEDDSRAQAIFQAIEDRCGTALETESGLRQAMGIAAHLKQRLEASHG